MSRTEPHRGLTSLLALCRQVPQKGLLVAMLSVTALAATGAAADPSRSDTEPPRPAEPGSAPEQGPQLAFAPFEDNAFVEARKSGVPVVLYFEADWCAPCREMHARTFRAPAVLEAAAGVRFFRVDMTTTDHYVGLVLKSFHVTGAPTVVLFGPDGKERARRFGFIPPEDFVKMLGDSRKPPPGT